MSLHVALIRGLVSRGGLHLGRVHRGLRCMFACRGLGCACVCGHLFARGGGSCALACYGLDFVCARSPVLRGHLIRCGGVGHKSSFLYGGRLLRPVYPLVAWHRYAPFCRHLPRRAVRAVCHLLRCAGRLPHAASHAACGLRGGRSCTACDLPGRALRRRCPKLRFVRRR